MIAASNMNKPANEAKNQGETSSHAFRMNAPFFRIIALLLVALALPITLLVIGVRGWIAKPQKLPDEPPVQIEGLRATLEEVANKNMPSHLLADERRRFIFSGTKMEMDELRSRIEKSAASLHGTVVSSGEEAPQRLLIQIPESTASLFESSVLQSARFQNDGGDSERQGNVRFYEIIFETQ